MNEKAVFRCVNLQGSTVGDAIGVQRIGNDAQLKATARLAYPKTGIRGGRATSRSKQRKSRQRERTTSGFDAGA